MKAFPTDYFYDDETKHEIMPSEGMDLRDYFAAKAMQALINDEKLKDTIIEMNQHISKTIPKLAYEYANEMMKMRESK